MSWHLLESTAALDAVLSDHAGAAYVAVDTEFRRRDTFFPQVALVQLCWGADAYLVDPLQLDNTDSLAALLTEPRVVKFIHSASEDLEVFAHWLGVLPSPLFDTQRAAALVGRGAGLSYRALVAEYFEIDLPKDETQSDWLQRPLSAAQAEYAAQDVSYLHPIGCSLLERAAEMGRLEWVLEEGERMAPGGKPPLSKFKSAYKLPLAQQRVLSAVVDWREHEARHRDRPRSWILSDKLVSALARVKPRSVAALSAIDEMPQGLVRRAGERLVSLIQAADDSEGGPPPALSPAPLNSQGRQLLSGLSEQLLEMARCMDIPPEVLMPKADLEHLIRQQSDPDLPSPSVWLGWRDVLVVQPLRRWLADHPAG